MLSCLYVARCYVASQVCEELLLQQGFRHSKAAGGLRCLGQSNSWWCTAMPHPTQISHPLCECKWWPKVQERLRSRSSTFTFSLPLAFADWDGIQLREDIYKSKKKYIAYTFSCVVLSMLDTSLLECSDLVCENMGTSIDGYCSPGR